ncbi:MAG: nicotinate (nicotinamide) nucleotide adenylyltransferase [Pseudomonadota bacterium]
MSLAPAAGRDEGSGGARRIGLFGGAFDPPHVAHVALARAAVEQLGLDELRILPTGDAWHKERALSPAMHRLAMANLAFGSLANTVVDDREIRRSGASYTIDTLEEVGREHPGSKLYLVIGGDQADAFRSWRRWQDILEIATVCIAERVRPLRPDVEAGSDDAVSEAFRILDLPLMPVSATDIRRQIAADAAEPGAISQLVPESVARYISLHRLYGNRPSQPPEATA